MDHIERDQVAQRDHREPVPSGRIARRRSTTRPAGVQRGLVVGAEDDPAEREAERMAEVVVAGLGDTRVAPAGPAIGRLGAPASAGLARLARPTPRVNRSVIRRVTAPADPQVAAQNKATALAEHRRDRIALQKIVKEGAKSSDRRTANACEWILDGRTKLYALNATGDATERIAHLGENRAKTEVWFPRGDGGAGDLLDPTIAEYNELDLDDDTNIVVDTDDGPRTNGWNGDGYIAVMLRGGQMSTKAVLETLRHEVQHDADKNREKGAGAVALPGDQQPDATDMAKKFERYKTEYRAYNYEGSKSYMKLSPTKVVTKYGFKWAERQLAIFEQIYDGYEHTVEWWDDSHLTGTVQAGAPQPKGSYTDSNIADQWKQSIEARRKALVDYVNPDDEGFNKYDSIRVDDFYQALDAVPKGTSTTAGKQMSNLCWKTGFLGKKDALYVLEESPDMRKKLREHLVDQAYVHIMKLLGEVAGVKKATSFEDLGKSSVANIQGVADALAKVPVGTSDTKDANVRKLRFATAKLTSKEAKQVLGHGSKLLNEIDHRLTGQAHTDYLQLLQDCVG